MKIIRYINRYRPIAIALLMIVSLFVVQGVLGQVRVDFKQRAAAETPNKKIYNIKGDFQMIGNTNLTLESYAEDKNNSSNNMIYVDVDGDPNTLNSSSATLQFTNENGALDDCTNIIYAGLYWTGRAHDGGNSPIEFTVGGGTDNRYNDDSFNGYSLSITSSDDSSNNTSNNNRRIATYKFTPQGSGNIVTFRYYSWSLQNNNNYRAKVTVQIGNGQETEVTGSLTSTNSDDYRFTFTNPYTINTGSETIYINYLRKRRTNNSINDNFRANVTTPVVKTLNKRQVKLKKAGDTYQTITASTGDIYYPSNADGNMYSAYAEVTDYVKTHGVGEYFVADMALIEGNGGGTGYYGGWGMIVIYENSQMKWRDITIFDGYAYVAGSTTVSHELEISGFNTAQSGDINMKLGIIAGEGDVGITGDYFQIRNHADTEWIHLNHELNPPTVSGGWFPTTTHNFFNGSIVPYSTTNPTRNPNLKNNTGLDIAMFNISNPNNSIITNSQTSTKFRYGSTQDTYIISTIAMAVDAYVPDVESVVSINSVNNNPFDQNGNYTVLPGDEIEFTIDVKNRGSEAVKDLKLEIPVPFTSSYVSAGATYNDGYNVGNGSTLIHDQGVPGTIVWNIGNLPVLPVSNNNEVLATLTFNLKITDDCTILSNTNCATFALGGSTSGEGVTSGTKFNFDRFISDFSQEGNCVGEPIYAPITLSINTDGLNCDPDELIRSFEFCDISEIPLAGIDGIRPQFPAGTRYYSAIEYYIFADNNDIVVISKEAAEMHEGTVYVRKNSAEGTQEYNENNNFPLAIGEGPKTYYAIAPGMYSTCYWEFTITVTERCGNYWVGTTDNDWGKKENWTYEIPAPDEDVEFATVVNNKGNAAVRDLHLDANRSINDLINGSTKNLVITTGNQLLIKGKVIDTNASAGTIIVQSAAGAPTGTLIFTNQTDNANVDATVQFYNKAYTCDNCGDIDRQKWQYFGVPVKSIGSMPFPTGITGTINKWSEPAFGNKWITPGSPLTAFTGYEINDAANATPNAIYNFAGKLNVGNASIGITKTISVNYSGRNLIGNSYTAAIPIANGFTFNGTWDNTVYLFNAGSRNEWRKLTGATVNGIESGRYLSVPTNTAGTGGLPDRIPSMHTFMIDATAGGSLAIDYSKLTKNALVGTGMAWRSASTQPTAMPYIVMEIIGSQSADKVWMFENITAKRSLDAGWDGVKMTESGLVQLYVSGEGDYKFQVATVPQLQGTTLGIKPDNNENMSISFAVSSDVEARNLYLRDLLTGRAYPIRNMSEYIVPGVSTEIGQRFRVVSIANDQMSKQSVGNEAIEVFAIDNQIGITNNSDENCAATVYDITGKAVEKMSVNKGSTQIISGSLKISTGIYVVKVTGKTVSETKRVMVK